jgi:hypothetical protein
MTVRQPRRSVRLSPLKSGRSDRHHAWLRASHPSLIIRASPSNHLTSLGQALDEIVRDERRRKERA